MTVNAAAGALDALRERFGEQYADGVSTREEHCQTQSWLPAQPPEAVVFAECSEDVVAVVQSCAADKVPIIPFGAGTSLEGQVNAPRGGVCVDLSRMNTIKEIRADDMLAVVEPGVTRQQLNAHLAGAGLFFSVDPGADATLGGMASTRASGTTSVRYGTMRDNVLALEVVLADGSRARAGTLARKSAAGYDLTHLLVGAEGTLGIITELSVRLHPLPCQIASAVCAFASVEAATRAVIGAIRSAIDLARIELLDDLSVRACNAYAQLGLEERVHLFVEFHGDDAHVRRQATRFGDVVEDCAGGPMVWTTAPEERANLWRARHDAWPAIHALFPGRKGIPTDVCVPISRLAECIADTQADIRQSRLDAPIIGHVGDGNFHLLIMVDPRDDEGVARAGGLTQRLNERAIRMGGTSTGEHGIGQGKAALMRIEHGSGVDVMRSVKGALDPGDIMNPGKLFP